MSLPVSGPDGKGKLMTTKKVYKAAQRDEIHLDKKEEILSYDSVPLIQVWPNIRLREPNEWKAYYTYFDLGDISIPFHATPIFKTVWLMKKICPIPVLKFVKVNHFLKLLYVNMRAKICMAN